MSLCLQGGRYVRDLACATGVALLSWFVTLLSVLIVALLVTLLGRSMFWYNHFYASVCLYGAAATGKMILIHTLAKNLYYGVSEWSFKYRASSKFQAETEWTDMINSSSNTECEMYC